MAQITLTFDFTPENVEVFRKMMEKLYLTLGQINAGLEQTSAKPAAPKPKTGNSKKAAPPVEEKTDTGETVITMTEIRAVALKLSQSGKQPILQDIFAKFDAKKLSDISQDDYPALMEELEAAANG